MCRPRSSRTPSTVYWGVERFLGEKLVQHSGNVDGLTANVTLLPESRSGVVVLANAEGANIFMETVRLHIAQLLLGRSSPDVNATLQAQLEVLGQDNASRKANLEAARTYQPERAELVPWAGTYESVADPQPHLRNACPARAARPLWQQPPHRRRPAIVRETLMRRRREPRCATSCLPTPQ